MKLTNEEIKKYLKDPNPKTGARGITEDDLKDIDLNTVQEIVLPKIFIDGAKITDKEGNELFKYDNFTPRRGSIYFKPSFAGRQILMGRVGRDLYFSDGRWFA